MGGSDSIIAYPDLIPEPPNPKAVRPTRSKYESSYWIDDETLGYATTTNPWNLQLPQAANFLLHSPWNDNAAIVDNKGKPLRHKDFPMMRICSVREIATYNGRDYEDCGIHCIKIKPPLSDAHSRSKYPAKIKSWCCSVLNNLPWNIWNIPEEDPKPMALPHLKQSLRWTMQDTGENPIIAAYRSSQPDNPVFHMTKSLDGWTWKLAWIDGDYQQCSDCRELQAWERTVGISFTSNPRTSIYPWHTHPETYAAHVAKALRNQRTKRSKLHSYYNLTPLIGRLQVRASISPWGQAALTQSPEQLWNREGLYTDYQNWTIYRIALGVLNLRHDGWPQDRQCPDPECSCMEETGNGGWVLHTHKSDSAWQATQAGSLCSTSSDNQTAIAAQVIQQGIQCLAAETAVQQVFLRINTLNKTVRKQVDKDDSKLDALRQSLSTFCEIMWAQPTQARLKAAKFLATRCANKKYDLRNNQQSAINDYIQKTAPQHYPTVTGTPRQTQDIVSCLTTYQASIENKT